MTRKTGKGYYVENRLCYDRIIRSFLILYSTLKRRQETKYAELVHAGARTVIRSGAFTLQK